MEKLKLIHAFKIAKHPDFGWIAVMEEMKCKTLPDRFFRIMDKTGYPELIHEKRIYKAHFYSSLSCNDSRDILVLLKELSFLDSFDNQIGFIISNFKTVYCNG
jgi:hypothetical protein